MATMTEMKYNAVTDQIAMFQKSMEQSYSRFDVSFSNVISVVVNEFAQRVIMSSGLLQPLEEVSLAPSTETKKGPIQQ